MEVGAHTAVNEAAASCSQSPTNSSAALPAAVIPACSAASPKGFQESEHKHLEQSSAEAGVPNTPEKLMQAGPGLVQLEPQFFQVAAAGDGSSSSVPDISHPLPAAVEGPFYFCANPMASMAMNSPFTPQRLPALQALQTPMQVCMAPVMVAFQAAYPMGPNGPMAAYPVMAQAAMAQANAAAVAAATVSAPVQHNAQQQSQQLSASESQPEVSPDLIARFEAGLRAVMTQPFSDSSSDPSAGDSSATGAAVGSNQWTQSSTGFKGVTKHKRTKRYEAHIWGHKQQVYLGSFDLGVQAARAHDIMALCNHGGVVYPGSQNALNFPPTVYSELLPFLGHLSQGDMLTALRNFGKKTPAARRAAAAAAVPVVPVERKRKSESSPQRATRSVSNNPTSKRQAVAASSEEEAEDADAEEAAALLHHFASGR